MSPLKIEGILEESQEGIKEILSQVNKFNELLYDWVIPKLFSELYDLIEFVNTEEEELELAKVPEQGYYEFKVLPELMAYFEENGFVNYKDKSFHLDRYCFDSRPELSCFNSLLNDKDIDKVYFTGMLTHGQSDFKISYIDPESHTVRNYYPDFLAINKDGSHTIIEVKRDDQIDDLIVKAKTKYAKEIASVNDFEYKIIKSSLAQQGLH